MQIDPIGRPLQQTIQNQVRKKEQDFANVLEQAQQSKDDKKLREACKGLESIFLNQVFESMRKTIPEGGLLEKSFAMSTFESMLFEEYSKQASSTSSIGLADILYKQLSTNK